KELPSGWRLPFQIVRFRRKRRPRCLNSSVFRGVWQTPPFQPRTPLLRHFAVSDRRKSPEATQDRSATSQSDHSGLGLLIRKVEPVVSTPVFLALLLVILFPLFAC